LLSSGRINSVPDGEKPHKNRRFQNLNFRKGYYRAYVSQKKQNLPVECLDRIFDVIDEARDFKFGKQLGFAKSHHQIPPEQKMDVSLG